MTALTRHPARHALRLGLQRMRLEPSSLVFAGILYLMVTAVLAGLWKTAAIANGGEIVGYSAVALVWYIATSEATTISLPLRLIEDIGIDIANGRVESELLRPVAPLPVRVAIEIGRMLPRLAVCAGLGFVFALVIGGSPISGVALLLAVPSLVLATSLNIVTQHLFAASTFWIRDAASSWFLYQKLVFVLGGMLLPLQVLPGTLELIARILPFSAMAYAPARLASGHVEPELLAIQFGWLVAFAALAAAAFRAGERRVVRQGA